MPTPSAQNRKERAAFHHLSQTLRGLEEDLRWGLLDSARIPPEWHAIAAADPVPGKRHTSLRVDEDVLRFFKAMGAGHLSRMNAVLRAFMLARLAGVVQGPEATAEARAQDVLASYLAEMAAYERDKPALEHRATHGPKAQEAMAELTARLDRIQRLTLELMG